MTDAEAEILFRQARWPETNGQPVCPTCGSLDVYDCRRPSGTARWRCKTCRADFSITSGTIFASHKMPLRIYLAAVAMFCNEVKGKSMLALSRDLGTQYKTAFVLAHKLREAMASDKSRSAAAENVFSRFRRGEVGHHHGISGPHRKRFIHEAAWREDKRRMTNGEQLRAVITLAMHCEPSTEFCGYWGRAEKRR